MTGWKIIDHSDDHVTVEFERDGQTQRLNFNVSALINRSLGTATPDQQGPGLRRGGVAYVFDQGGTLPAHAHDATSLHDIEVVEGTVLIEKDSGDVTATAGDIIGIDVGETHSILALTAARTVHWLKRSP